MNSQEYSFAQLASKNYIRIPNLQRVYAQGRNTDKAIEIRNNFITDLKKALDNEKPLSLDTVYGEMKNGTFTPLDGQQRLTTLFLLHLYLARYICTGNQLPDFLVDNEGKPKFCYATRTASEDFCKYLIEKNLNKKVNILAYPYGFSNDAVRNEARIAGYDVCVEINDKIQKVNTSVSNPFKLCRITAHGGVSGAELINTIEGATYEN